MKNSNNRIRISSILLLVIAVFVSVSCRGIYDNVEKFVDGEIFYIERLDGILKVQVGYERVEIDLLEAGRIPASQIRMAKATKTVIECPDFTEPGKRRVIDSICSWVNVTGLTQLKYYELTIYTEDNYGNRSLPMKTSVRPYTEENYNSLELMPPTINTSASAAMVEWLEGLSALTHQVYRSEWQYTERGGVVNTGRESGDKPIIFVDNVDSDINIPVSLTCRIIPKIFDETGTYTPILDSLDFQMTFIVRLLSSAGEVIFLKTPGPANEYDPEEKLSVTFSWTRSDAANGYTLKFSTDPSFPPQATYSVNTGNQNEYVVNYAGVLNFINSLSMNYNSNGVLYWTVTPTTQSAPIRTSFRLFRLLKMAYFFNMYERTGWEATASDTHTGQSPNNILDGNMSTMWHSNYTGGATPLPHWVVIDMKKPIKIYKIHTYRRTAANISDTRTIELYMSDNPEEDIWEYIGQGTYPNNDTVGLLEIFTNNVTTRYLKLVMPDSYRVPYANLFEVFAFFE